MSERQLTGKIHRSGIGRLDLPAISPETIEEFRALGADLSSLVSDVLDEMGYAKAIGASVLRPIYQGAALVGRALTLRNVVQETSPYKGASAKISRLAEIEAHNLAEPGDVLVIQGVHGVSNIGGISAAIGKRQGEIGAIVDGGVRDVGECRSIGYPMWSRDVTPLTGKWRIQTVQINHPVEIAGVQVTPGDIVIADETGICFVPQEIAADVLRRAREIAGAEARRQEDIAAGMPVPDLANRAGSFTMPKQDK
ncbi:RraA family protein [Sinorhizobium mexicanum]|uniref:Putative 4-hydroxy-4-methyl-2-oxoglutarate aldolase n=1 Tax=Sinorhizobium mexicanum TaxID=375549 RepID=A0A859QKI9_9HYPH|nr:RraA family protein [Sinorhizobium mexicanum]MBP1883779.1 regulator of RNase E activity RraA [Sinorhizobium mexicanum]QLL62950.1 RraA family protein [Sinorhizobium mexicanum]